MEWHPIWQQLSYRARTWFGQKARRHHRKSGQLHPRARIGVNACEPRESPTAFSGWSGTLAQVLRPGWEATQYSAASTIAISTPPLRSLTTHAGDNDAAGWWTATSTMPRRGGENDTTVSSSDSTTDENAWNWTIFPSDSSAPPMGAEPQLGLAAGPVSAASGSLAVQPWTSAGETSKPAFLSGSAFGTPTADQGFVPPNLASPSSGLPASAIGGGHNKPSNAGTITHHSTPPPALAAPLGGNTNTTFAAHSTLPAPALPSSPFIVSHVGPNVVPLLFSSTADDPAMKLV